ncbi:hypothetical protein [Amycolatopsis plumensis]|uniref:Integral membrane protein n=1 Tax=Amycolatopsis plumensis TaxID=236508 RepID=A0ABV5TWJ9_9PSEU
MANLESWQLIAGVGGGIVLALIFLWALAGSVGAVSVTKKSRKSSAANKGLARGYALLALGLAAFLEAKVLFKDGETTQFTLFAIGGLLLIIAIVVIIGAERKQKKGV